MIAIFEILAIPTMKKLLFLALLTIAPVASQAAMCDKTWFHLAGLSKHIEIYQPNEYTRFRRETHPGLGVECQNKRYTIAAGQFTNSLNRPFQYITASKNVFSISKFNLHAGVLAGEYGLTVREPLRLVAPIVYLETHLSHIGVNVFALPPMKGFNDYAIFFTQFKIGF